MDEITGDTILQMQAALLEDGLCNNTVAKDHRFLKQAMQYAEDSGIIDRTPFTRRVLAFPKLFSFFFRHYYGERTKCARSRGS